MRLLLSKKGHFGAIFPLKGAIWGAVTCKKGAVTCRNCAVTCRNGAAIGLCFFCTFCTFFIWEENTLVTEPTRFWGFEAPQRGPKNRPFLRWKWPKTGSIMEAYGIHREGNKRGTHLKGAQRALRSVSNTSYT